MSREIVKTEKWWIHYSDGSKALDVECSQSAYTLGFSNHEIIDAMAEQLKSVSRVIPYWDESHPEIEKLRQSVYGSGNDNWRAMKFMTSGTSAVEAAIAAHDEYWAKEDPRKTKILSYTPVWHGTTYITRGLNNLKQNVLNSSRILNVDTPNWLKYEDRDLEEERALADTEEYFKQGDVGGVIFNPVAWFNGVMPFSKNWWHRLRELCDKYDVLMILDDITACWGKVGTWQSFTGIGDGVKPDISALGKSIAAGHAPFGLTVWNEKVFSRVPMFMYGHAWNPSMGAVAAMNKTTDIIKRDGLLEHSNTVERKNIEMCQRLGDRIAGYRSVGCFLAIDFHEDIPHEKYMSGGLSTKYRPYVLKLTSPLIADDSYHAALEEKIENILI